MSLFAKRERTSRLLTVWLVIVAITLAPALSNRGVLALLWPATAEAQTVSTTTYTYDNNGNMVTRTTGTQTDTFTYDAENRLINANMQSGTTPGLITYAYDADGMRTGKTADGVPTTFLLDKNREHAQVVSETTGSSTTAYTYGNQLVNQTRSGTGTHFYLSDGQLSIRQLTTSAGVASDTYTYDAFGVTMGSTGTTINLYRYTGEQLDPNTDFYYLRARYYNQATGSFVTTDPLDGSIFDPVSLHRYLYANANPVNNRDPSGLSIGFFEVALFLAVVAAVALNYFGGGALPWTQQKYSSADTPAYTHARYDEFVHKESIDSDYAPANAASAREKYSTGFAKFLQQHTLKQPDVNYEAFFTKSKVGTFNYFFILVKVNGQQKFIITAPYQEKNQFNTGGDDMVWTIADWKYKWLPGKDVSGTFDTAGRPLKIN